jgi:hypothetical protein
VHHGIQPVFAQFGMDDAEHEGKGDKGGGRADRRVQDDAFRHLPLAATPRP